MRIVLHLFRKDAIRLWLQVSMFLSLLALNGWSDRHYAPADPPKRYSACNYSSLRLISFP
jgi:hypothetical protein